MSSATAALRELARRGCADVFCCGLCASCTACVALRIAFGAERKG